MAVQRKAVVSALDAAKDYAPASNDGAPAGEADAAPAIVRPSYVVRDDWEDVDGKRRKPGVWWHSSVTDKKGEVHLIDEWICAPLHVEAVTCGDDGHGFGRMLRFRDSFGRWKTWSMPMSMLAGSCEELRGELLAAGLEMDIFKVRNHLPTYLQWRVPKARITAATRTGWSNERTAFVLPDGVIPQGSQVFFQSEHAHQDAAAGKRGTLEGWQANVAAHCAGNPVLVLSVCVALAGPLLRVVHAESGGVHWVGASSKGKTTGLHVGASCWGGETFCRTWQATGNGLEGVAALVNDTVLCLDELKEARPQDVDSIIYALGNGVGKTRADRIGAARKAQRWRVTLLSTGEKTVATHMAEAGKRPDAGVLVRLLNIPATGFAHGAFDDLCGFPGGQAFADQLKNAVAIDYGWAGPRFAWHIIESLKAGRDFGAELAAMKALRQFTAEESQAGRVAGRFALYAFAGELAAEWGIVPWKTGEAIHAAIKCFDLWKSAHGGGQNAEQRRVLQAVEDYIGRYGDTRFTSRTDKDAKPVGGQRAGWWDDSRASRTYLFTSAALQEAVPGTDMASITSVLDDAGWLSEKDYGKTSKVTKLGGRSMRLYWICPKEADV